MIFEFAKYTEITDHVFSREAGHKESGYIRFFICPDVWDFHFIRVLPGFDEDFNSHPEKIVVEHDKISKDDRSERLTMRKLNHIIDEDEFSNWDYHIFRNMDSAIESIDGGFGILNLKEEAS